MRLYRSQLLKQAKDITIDFATGKLKNIIIGKKGYSVRDVIDWEDFKLKDDAKNVKTPAGDFIKKQRVFTREGKYLGIATDFQFDTEQLILTQIVVRNKWTISQLFKRKYRLIASGQIFKITPKQIIVISEFEAVIKKTAQPLGATL